MCVHQLDLGERDAVEGWDHDTEEERTERATYYCYEIQSNTSPASCQILNRTAAAYTLFSDRCAFNSMFQSMQQLRLHLRKFLNSDLLELVPRLKQELELRHRL